jgi:acyl-CoA thioesterase
MDVSSDWMQGRSVFGGLQAALGVRAMRTLLPAQLPLRTLQVAFVGPVSGGTVDARAQVLRTGKNATQIAAQLVADDEVLASMIGIFGAPRESAVDVLPTQPAVANHKPIEFRFMPGITPEFTQHFRSRWLRGGIPFTGVTETENVIEIDMVDEGSASELHALAIADLIPPITLSLLKKPVNGSSMTWMLEFLTDRFSGLPLKGWRVDAQLMAAHDGYTSQSLVLWGPGGIPVALSRQSMVVFG